MGRGRKERWKQTDSADLCQKSRSVCRNPRERSPEAVVDKIGSACGEINRRKPSGLGCLKAAEWSRAPASQSLLQTASNLRGWDGFLPQGLSYRIRKLCQESR